MAFCKYCGRQLSDGEVCNCPDSLAQGIQPDVESPAPAQNPTPTSGPSINISLPDKETVLGVVNNTLASFLNVLKDPAGGGRTFVQTAKLPVSLALVGVQAILSAIFSLLVVGQINNLIGLGGAFLAQYKFSGLAAFFLTLIFSVILSAVLALLYKGVTLIFKLKTSWEQVAAMAAIRSIAVIPCIVLACVLFLINLGLGVAVFYGSTLLALCFLLEATKGISGIPEKNVLYTVFGVMVVFLMIGAIIAANAYPLYVPSSIKGIDISSILGSLI